jgi:hypothetical protein
MVAIPRVERTDFNGTYRGIQELQPCQLFLIVRLVDPSFAPSIPISLELTSKVVAG